LGIKIAQRKNNYLIKKGKRIAVEEWVPWNNRVSGETPVVFDSVKIRMANPAKQNLDSDVINTVFPAMITTNEDKIDLNQH